MNFILFDTRWHQSARELFVPKMQFFHEATKNVWKTKFYPNIFWGIWGQILNIAESGQIIHKNGALDVNFSLKSVSRLFKVIRGREKRSKKVKFRTLSKMDNLYVKMTIFTWVFRKRLLHGYQRSIKLENCKIKDEKGQLPIFRSIEFLVNS